MEDARKALMELHQKANNIDLRDKIAIKAMESLLPTYRFGINELAEKSYQIADAMMEARNGYKE